ncbi:kinase-like domain-containing protein [Morchella snyderi]|nr:kinase-like domain-containing protein [Morchella snyderi]
MFLKDLLTLRESVFSPSKAIFLCRLTNRIVGEGGFGKVYRVRCMKSRKNLARKEVNWATMPRHFHKMLQNEARMLAEIRHPNIVEYHGAVNDIPNTTLHLIMEYCPLGDLKHYINGFVSRGKMIPEVKIWEILEQLTMALFRCHNGYNHHRDLAGKHGSALYSDSPRFFHRDLKPENSNTVKLGDFGVCGRLEPGQQMRTTFVGTSSYMCPELLLCDPYTAKSEVWGLGCILHELCTRTLTFTQPPADGLDTHMDYIGTVRGAYPDIPDLYSNDLKKLIEGCLLVDAEERPGVTEIADNPCVVMARGDRRLEMARATWESEKAISIREADQRHHRLMKNFWVKYDEAISILPERMVHQDGMTRYNRAHKDVPATAKERKGDDYDDDLSTEYMGSEGSNDDHKMEY